MAGTSANEEIVSQTSQMNTVSESTRKKTEKKKTTKEPETNSTVIDFNLNVAGTSGIETSGQKRKVRKPEEDCNEEDVVVQKCVPPKVKKQSMLKSYFNQ